MFHHPHDSLRKVEKSAFWEGGRCCANIVNTVNKYCKKHVCAINKYIRACSSAGLQARPWPSIGPRYRYFKHISVFLFRRRG